MRKIFLPVGMLIPPKRPNEDMFTVIDVDGFRERVQKGAAAAKQKGESTAFFEKEVARHLDCFGNVCQAFSTYEARRAPRRREAFRERASTASSSSTTASAGGSPPSSGTPSARTTRSRRVPREVGAALRRRRGRALSSARSRLPTASMRMARRRFRSRLCSAAIAVPPGDVTMSFITAGWIFMTSAILAAPSTVCDRQRRGHVPREADAHAGVREPLDDLEHVHRAAARETRHGVELILGKLDHETDRLEDLPGLRHSGRTSVPSRAEHRGGETHDGGDVRHRSDDRDPVPHDRLDARRRETGRDRDEQALG